MTLAADIGGFISAISCSMGSSFFGGGITGTVDESMADFLPEERLRFFLGVVSGGGGIGSSV